MGALPLTAGPVLGDALDGWDTNVRRPGLDRAVGAVAGDLVATLVPHPLALTTWRVLTPAAAAAVALAAVGGHTSFLAA